jgi:hypothetical protein
MHPLLDTDHHPGAADGRERIEAPLRSLSSVPTDHAAHNDKRSELNANSAHGTVQRR